jgi:hypothetical protein
MVVTLEVSHRDISALKDTLSKNKLDMSVTSDTSQSGISSLSAAPQSTSGLEQHATPVGSPTVAAVVEFQVGSRQLATAASSAALSANGAADAIGAPESTRTARRMPTREIRADRPAPRLDVSARVEPMSNLFSLGKVGKGRRVSGNSSTASISVRASARAVRRIGHPGRRVIDRDSRIDRR